MRAAVTSRTLIALGLIMWLGGGVWVIYSWLGPAPKVPVVIYLVDTLRADRLGIYGYARPTSPAIDRLAAESVLFGRAYAPAPWTLPSVASMITSTFPCEHGVLTEKRSLDPTFRTLQQRLGEIGYLTIGRYNNVSVGPMSGLDRGFADFEKFEGLVGDTSEELAALLDEMMKIPSTYTYIHTLEPHDPHLTPPEYHALVLGKTINIDRRSELHKRMRAFQRLTVVDFSSNRARGTTDNTQEQDAGMEYLAGQQATLSDLYDASVRWADDNLGRFINELKARGIWDEAIFVFVSDHGEEFDEHARWGHGQTVYEAVARVPLLMHFPGGRFGGTRVEATVSLVDIMPTLLDFLGESERCEGCRGRSLMPLIEGRNAGSPVVDIVPAMRINERNYYRPWKESRGDINIVVRRGDWKGIWNLEPGFLELFDLSLDPDEFEDRSMRQPELTRELTAAAQDWYETCLARQPELGEQQEIDEATQEQLRALGYL